MTQVQDLARFVAAADADAMSPQALDQLKIRVLDTLGAAIGALDAEPVVAIRGLLDDLGGAPTATLVGGGKTSPPPRASARPAPSSSRRCASPWTRSPTRAVLLHLRTRRLQDAFDVAGQWVDGIKWAGGSFALTSEEQVRKFSDMSSGLQRLVEKVVKAGLKAKPELGIQIGSGGDSSTAELAGATTEDIGDLIDRGREALDAGASIIMIESEGITENVSTWNTGAAASIMNGLGMENVMFEAADGPVFEWYVENYGNEVDLFVDHSRILQLEGLRENIWGNGSTWVVSSTPHPDRLSG